MFWLHLMVLLYLCSLQKGDNTVFYPSGRLILGTMILLLNAFDYFAENILLKNSIVSRVECFVTKNIISTLMLLTLAYDVYIRNKCIHYSPLLRSCANVMSPVTIRGSFNWNFTSFGVGKYIVAIKSLFLKLFMVWASLIFIILFPVLSALCGYPSSSFGVPAISYCSAHFVAFLAL
jgi:hypothetical protein